MADTIHALASGALPSAVAVVRVSGPRALAVAAAVAGEGLEARRLHHRAFRAPSGERIDRGLVVVFPSPASATGEDAAEFHLHGGRAVVAWLSETLNALGCRPAEAGEFTKRAFLNGKLDLVQAEAVADLVSADTRAQLRFAERALGGETSRLYADWRTRVLHARAMIEAELDFADESDVPGSVSALVWADVAALTQEINDHARRFAQAEILRDGFEVVILGVPNAGKSSLLNALAQREAAIVSEEAGTTRDLIEVQLDLDGLKVRLVDTAGLREGAQSPVERIGMARARDRATQAGLVLLLTDLSAPPAPVDPPTGVPLLTVGTKADIAPTHDRRTCDHAVSARSGEGLAPLLAALSARAADAVGLGSELLPARERHVAQLRTAGEHLNAALSATDAPLELRAEELRLGAVALGRITGAIDTEDVLGAIFSRFCIGK